MSLSCFTSASRIGPAWVCSSWGKSASYCGLHERAVLKEAQLFSRVGMCLQRAWDSACCGSIPEPEANICTSAKNLRSDADPGSSPKKREASWCTSSVSMPI